MELPPNNKFIEMSKLIKMDISKFENSIIPNSIIIELFATMSLKIWDKLLDIENQIKKEEK
jgi:hypothetical protein